LWEQYRWQVILAAAALVAQSLLIAALFYQRRRRRYAEMEARRRMDELAIMNRRATVGEMSASIAHEIKQPLSTIVTNGDAVLRWLAKQTPNLEEASAGVKNIISEAHRANRVIESVRTMFKRGAQARDLLDINDVIRDVLALQQIELDANAVEVSSALMDNAPRVLGDRSQLQQVVLNLVRNAIEAMSPIKDRPRVLQIRSETTDQRELVVTVKDSGPGINAENMNRVFETFFTTKNTGMGMGLSICRSIIEAHGGRLSAQPSNPQGAVFEIVLPLPPHENRHTGT
jgi:C4-dicarboxylate-specific signal transduction histidine kinase